MSLNLPIAELVLERGDSGLGFNIRGGTDIPHVPGDSGIFVTRLKEDGAAFKDGRLKEGDKILEVNGKSIERVTHNEAVQIFITAGNTVRMKVQHGAYAELMHHTTDPGVVETHVGRPVAPKTGLFLDAHHDQNQQKNLNSQKGGGSVSVKMIAVAVAILAMAGIGAFLYQRQQQG